MNHSINPQIHQPQTFTVGALAGEPCFYGAQQGITSEPLGKVQSKTEAASQ